jgi:hypothetical protein
MAGPEGSMQVETEGGFDRKTCSVAAAIRRMTPRLRGSRRPVGSENNDYLALGDRFVASVTAPPTNGSARAQLGVQGADQAGHRGIEELAVIGVVAGEALRAALRSIACTSSSAPPPFFSSRSLTC